MIMPDFVDRSSSYWWPNRTSSHLGAGSSALFALYCIRVIAGHGRNEYPSNSCRPQQRFAAHFDDKWRDQRPDTEKCDQGGDTGIRGSIGAQPPEVEPREDEDGCSDDDVVPDGRLGGHKEERDGDDNCTQQRRYATQHLQRARIGVL